MYSMKVKHIIPDSGIYRAKGVSECKKLELISTFLGEISFLTEYVKQCVEEDNGLNYMSVLLNRDGDDVTLLYIDEEDDTWPRFTMTKEKFFSILDRWNEVYLTFPPYIEVSIDEQDNITINPTQE